MPDTEQRSKSIKKPEHHILPLKIPLTVQRMPCSPPSSPRQQSYKALFQSCVCICVLEMRRGTQPSVISLCHLEHLTKTRPGSPGPQTRMFRNHTNDHVHTSRGSVTQTNDTHAMPLLLRDGGTLRRTQCKRLSGKTHTYRTGHGG